MGQLAVDLLVSTMKATRIGYLDDPFVLPCIGNNAYEPFPHVELALPLEGLSCLVVIYFKNFLKWY